MNVREVEIHECYEGDILASDVFNPDGLTLVARDTQLNAYIKNRLSSLGIRSVRIYRNCEIDNDDKPISDEEFKNSYSEAVLQTKSMIHELAAGKPLDLIKVSKISDRIKENIDNNNIVRCLLEIKSADEYTFAHCVNVAFYSMLIAKWMKLSVEQTNNVIQSGLLHDIGKSKIPSTILNKGGILTKEEYGVIKLHTVLGYEIVRGINNIDEEVKYAVLLHHERLDGSGYPLNSFSDSINLFSRIVAIADVFDAMTSERVYKKRSTPFEAFEMFKTIGMSMFDTEIINIFINKMATNLVGSKVQLNNGEVGDIAYIPLHNVICPIIKISSGYLDISKEKEIKIECII
jgi:putative nucleotidyltransferase with HDIG domain